MMHDCQTLCGCRPSSASTEDDWELEEELEEERYADLAQDLKEDAAASPATPAGIALIRDGACSCYPGRSAASSCICTIHRRLHHHHILPLLCP